MRPFQTDKGAHIHVFPITITMGASATFRCVIYTSSSTYDKTFNLDGADYANWGTSDDYIKEYICDKEGFIGRPIPENETPINFQETQNDSRSVHNEADIEKIQTLQTQLDTQAAKLKTITDMLIGKGLV